MHEAPSDKTYHATCVAVDGVGVLILGASGRGKSALALQLMSLGARLVSDDRTVLKQKQGQLFAEAPPQIKGWIEARGVGVLRAETVPSAAIRLVVDLDQQETERLPPARHKDVLGLRIPCVHKIEGGHFPAAIMQYVKGGRQDTL